MNSRFVNKALIKSDLNTLNALIKYFEFGGTITICKPGKRSKSNTSFPMVHGTISNMGAKAVSLTKNGSPSKRKRG